MLALKPAMSGSFFQPAMSSHSWSVKKIASTVPKGRNVTKIVAPGLGVISRNSLEKLPVQY